MTPLEAIAECRKAHKIVGGCWPGPLITYLYEPSDTSRVFNWLCPCISVVISRLGVLTDEFQQALRFAQNQATNGINKEDVEKLAESFWLRRGKEGAAFTAIAQLLYALSRFDRSNGKVLGRSATTPLFLLQELESRDGEVLDYVIENFSTYVSRNAE